MQKNSSIDIICDYKPTHQQLFLKYDGQKLQIVIVSVCLKVTSIEVAPGYYLIHTQNKPTIPVTVMFLGEVFQRYRNNYSSHKEHSYLPTGSWYEKLQGHKDNNTAIIQNSYEDCIAYTLSLTPESESVEPNIFLFFTYSMNTNITSDINDFLNMHK